MSPQTVYVGPPNAGVVMISHPYAEGRPEEKGVLAMHSAMCGCIDKFHSECLAQHEWLRSECGCVSIMLCPLKKGFIDMMIQMKGAHYADECFVSTFLDGWRQQVYELNSLEKLWNA